MLKRYPIVDVGDEHELTDTIGGCHEANKEWVEAAEVRALGDCKPKQVLAEESGEA